MLRQIEIDDRMWSEASTERRYEWRGCINALLEPSILVIRSDVERLVVRLTEQTAQIDAFGAAGEPIAKVVIPHEALADHMTEYVDIVRQLAKEDAPGGGLARLEALDMAKKVAHDAAGRTVRRHCKELEIDLPTARRLFSLLFALKVDTTRLHGAHGHRRIK